MSKTSCDVAIIGAGPAGSTAAAVLAHHGYDVVVLERDHFPRFAIGESLLPQCMAFLDEAGLLNTVNAAGFQVKNGAVFYRNGHTPSFAFEDKFTAGWSTTFQVQRARFDQILAQEAASAGADIRFGHAMRDIDLSSERPVLEFSHGQGEPGRLEARFCLDASGFARKLAHSLDRDQSSGFPEREAVFTHVIDGIDPACFDRNKILISVHPEHQDVWYWLIPFADGTSSLGVVGSKEHFSSHSVDSDQILCRHVDEAKRFGGVLDNVEYHLPARRITGYSSAACRPYGRNFALLGNAAGFLDPIFSSGVTIALKSATVAARLVDRQFKGHAVDWEIEFSRVVQPGVETFRHFVTAWYDGRLQDIIFSRRSQPRIKRMICSVLAGYAWDNTNPFVAHSGRRLTALADVCRRLQ